MKIASLLKQIGLLFFFPILPTPVLALMPDQIFDKVKDSIVVVTILDTQGKVKSQGSGVLLPSGKIGTNCHIMAGSDSFQVRRGKQIVSAFICGRRG